MNKSERFCLHLIVWFLVGYFLPEMIFHVLVFCNPNMEIPESRYEEVWNDMHSGTWSEVRTAMEDEKITYREFYQLKDVAKKRAKFTLQEWCNEQE